MTLEKQNGFSTGCLYRTNLSLYNILGLYSSLRARAVELSFVNESMLDNFNLTPQIADRIKKFEYVSVHAPWHTDNHASYDKVGSGILAKLKKLNEKLPISGIVFHPDKFEDFSLLEKSGLPVLIENMDVRKTQGITPDYFAKLRKDFDFGFVLDLQHAYEHDNTMMLADDLIEVMGTKLRHLHVSGCNSDNPMHSLVYCSGNRDAIASALDKTGDAPRILEGLITAPLGKTAAKDLRFLKSLEG